MAQSLLDTIVIPVTPFHQERLVIIDQEDYSGVEWKARDELEKQGRVVTDEYMDEGILALKQYYAGALLDSRNEHAVSDALDPFWHAHILHTRQYASFCDRVFGEFAHHEPLNHVHKDQVEYVGGLYHYTARVYREIYGYLNPLFYPENPPDIRLCCTHGSCGVIMRHGLFPHDSATRVAVPA